jgi:putative oxidoreductase
MEALRRLVSHRRAVRGGQLLIGLIFATASLSKIGDLSAFAVQVHNFRLAPVWSENLIAMTLPWIELAAALSLLSGVRPRAGALIVAVLMAGFTVGVVVAMVRGLDFECGCFGTADHTRVGAVKLAENLLMLGISLLAVRRPLPAGPSASTSRAY